MLLIARGPPGSFARARQQAPPAEGHTAGEGGGALGAAGGGGGGGGTLARLVQSDARSSRDRVTVKGLLELATGAAPTKNATWATEAGKVRSG